MNIKPGKYTVELFAEKQNLTRQSALNKLSGLKKQRLVSVSGGGRQKRIYTVYKKPKNPENGFFSIVNKYSPIKLNPKFEHYVYGRYTIEHAIIDGLAFEDIRTKRAVSHLFRHISDWKRLFDLAKQRNLVDKLYKQYKYAKTMTKCRTMPKKYQK